MRILVFSDIHGNAYAMDGFMEILSKLTYDAIAFLGDIFGYYYEQEKCICRMKDISNLIWLKGNHDAYAVKAFYNDRKEQDLIRNYGHSYCNLNKRFLPADMDMIDALPQYYECALYGKKIGFFHGRPDNPLEGRIYEDTLISDEEVSTYDIIFFGHTHCKIDRFVDKTHILSPGSLGQPRDGKGYGFLIYDLEADSCEYINVDVDNTVLRDDIDRKDRGLSKLYDVLSREEIK